MFRRFCTNGEREVLKGAFHAAGCTLAALMATYNTVAWCYRRERHLGVNAVVYTLATLWEVRQTAHHFDGNDSTCANERPRTLTLVRSNDSVSSAAA
jgi:hypothetical protein